VTPLTRATLAFGAGTLLGLRAAWPPGLLLAGIAVALACACLLLRGPPPRPSEAAHPVAAADAALRRSAKRGAALLVLFAGLGFLSAAAEAWRARTDCRVRFVDGAQLTVRGALETALGPEGSGWLRIESVRVDGRDHACPGMVRVTLRRVQRPRAGVRIVATGRWWSFPREGVWPVRPEKTGTLSVQSVRALEGNVVVHPLLHARGAARERLGVLFGQRRGLAEALLIAERGGIEPSVRQQFAAAGLTHLLSISGTHVALVAGVLLLVAGVLRLGPVWGGVVAAAGTVGYVLFLGAPHAASRAALQIVLLLAARLTQRPSEPFTLLACAGLLLLAADPLAALDAGFQLSFAGIFGLLTLRRPLLAKMPPRWPGWLRDGLASGTAATLTTTPIAALHFGLVAFVGIIANLTAIPLVGLCVPAVALTLVVGAVSNAGGAFLATGAGLLLEGLARTARLAATVPFGRAYVSRATVLAWLSAAGVFLIVGGTLFRTARRRQPAAGGGSVVRVLPLNRLVAIAAAVAVLVAWPTDGGLRPGDLEIHAIDVGQGDAFAIRTPGGPWILVDTGPRSHDFDAGASRVLPFLLRHGVDRVHAVILTHPHADHIGGLQALLGAMAVKAVIDPAVPEASELYASTIAAAGRQGVGWFAAREGRELRVGDLVIRFLAPMDDLLETQTDPKRLLRRVPPGLGRVRRAVYR
jgi:competence protein ComEC